jgi:hypothetical protein
MFTGSIVCVALGTHEICFFNCYIIFSASLLPFAHVGLCYSLYGACMHM